MHFNNTVGHLFWGLQILQISWIFRTSMKIVSPTEILSWHGLQTEEKTTVFLTCRYRAWRFPNTYLHIATTQSLAKASIHPCSFAYNQIDLRVSHFISIDKCSLKWSGYVHTWITHDTKLNFPGVSHISVLITYKSTCMYCKEWWLVLYIYSLTIGQTLFLHWVLLLTAMMPLCAKIVVWLCEHYQCRFVKIVSSSFLL